MGEFIIGFQRGCRAGKQAPKMMAEGAKIVLKPVYNVTVKVLVAMDKISRESVRQGYLTGGVGCGEYADDGENVLIDINTEDA